QHATGGHTSFLLGQLSNGWWYYYIIAFLVKTPIPAIVFIFSSFVFWKPKKDKDNIAKMVLLIPVFVLFGFALSTRINLGIRYLLPIFPLLYVFLSFLAERFSFKDIRNLAKNKFSFAGIFGVIFIVLISWHLVSSLRIYPSYLAYFNEAIGGPQNGMRYVTDSNLDWGQDVKRLKTYVEKHNIDKMIVDYFGKGNPKYYLGDKYIEWSANKKQEPGWYAISATYFQQANAYGDYQWLKNVKPYTTIGYSILIFKYQI
ncbi:hypothetical protein HGB13_04095, partial [bacterium]|nr:hypothetical protein [bacterium]